MVERWTGVWGKCRRCLALAIAQPDVGHDRRRHGHRARSRDSTGRSPTTPRRTGTARHRHPLGDRLPRGHTALQRWLRGHRGLLRDLGIRDHRLVAAGARDNGTHVSAQLLWAPGAPHPSDGDARHHRHHHCFVRVHRRLRRRPDRYRRPVGRPLPRQLPLRRDGYQLPRGPVAAVATAELLVPRCRGAVLHCLPGALLVLGVVGPAGRRGSFRLRITVVLVAVIVASYTYSIVFTASNAQSAYFSLLVRSWELALGGLIAVYSPELRRIPQAWAAVASWVGLAVILVASVTLTPASDYPGALVAIPTLGRRSRDCRRCVRSEVGGRGPSSPPAVSLPRPHLLLALPVALADPRDRRAAPGGCDTAGVGRRLVVGGRRGTGVTDLSVH